MGISIFELFFFIFLACAWPVSMARMIRNRSTKGKSLLFSCAILLGYIFGIAHKFIYDLDIIVGIYFLNMMLCLADAVIFLFIKNKYEKENS